ncbi:SsgA family sporulation/cell division regulator (plasmid) [Streptosporangium sp. NBC_01495]|uniref:SsgA family sporulation/cell division regulator n=1 Tax=Streptosporangium sp. NBC_01495 TaxID=2903899 RepID=UPI002E31C8C9|nr:SsgA family sporulation/cell division regulator [Streptosporangium sp. NBC_01495]
MSTRFKPIGVWLGARFLNSPAQQDVRVIYEPTDPYGVQLQFPRDGDEPVVWVMARSLLLLGLTPDRRKTVGDGDVTVGPAPLPPDVAITLKPPYPYQPLTVLLSRTELGAFILETLELIPDGQESQHLDVDGAIAVILAEAAP